VQRALMIASNQARGVPLWLFVRKRRDALGLRQRQPGGWIV
jgi:ribosomal protein L39E